MGLRSTIASILSPRGAAAGAQSATEAAAAAGSLAIASQGAPAEIKNATPLPMITRTAQSWSDFVATVGKLPVPTEQTALTISAIYACVNLIAGAISSLPLVPYRVDVSTGERDRIFDDPLCWVFNEQMAPRWAAANGWEFLVQSLLMHGDGIAIIQRAGVDARPVGLVPVHTRRVTVLPSVDATRLIYVIEPEFAGGDRAVYDQDDILHFAGFGFDGLRGMSPLRYALRMAAPTAIAMQEFAANFFANSGRPDYALKTAQALGKDAIDELRAQIEERHVGTENAGRPMLLHSGLDIATITMPLEDMQLVASREFQVEEIARIYGVPPFMIGKTDKTTSWGSGVESMGTGFVRYTLRQHLVKIENEINRKIFRTATRVVEHDTAELERADLKSLYEAMRIALGRAGERQILTLNEIRSILRFKHEDSPAANELGVNPAAPNTKGPTDAAA